MADRVLVVDAQERKAVPVIRALGRAGLHVVGGESSRWAMGFYSKYCRERHVYPPPEREEAFVEWLVAKGREGLFDVIIPVDERTMTPVTRHRAALLEHVRVPVVDYDTYLLARDKQKTMEVARKVGVPAPETWWFPSVEEFDDRIGEVECPVVIKPRTSSGSRGVRRVYSRDQLRRAVHERPEQCGEYLIQELVPPGGDTLGVELLLDHGQVLARFMHRRLREYPVSGGPSTLRESVHDPELIEQASKLMSSMGWHGVAMVEFKTDPRDGTAKLMEVNAKFWGSVALAILAGVNFPVLLYQLAMGEVREVREQYRLGVRSRWLLPGDLLHFVTNPDRFRLQPSFFEFRGTHDDLLDRDDPGPVAGMFLSFASRAFTRTLWRDKFRL